MVAQNEIFTTTAQYFIFTFSIIFNEKLASGRISNIASARWAWAAGE